ncbi:MAG: flagellar basal body P-ring formation chaperone FlgA [Halanaerobiales bacterium]|nr:flagellar basal body P-ring formation chaperone FlgA [Halanaerobiales bacterium]
MKKIILLSLILVLFSCSASAFEVSISGEESVSAEKIRLGEIARIGGFSASDGSLSELQNLELASSPQAGYSKKLSRVLVDLSIKNLGYAQTEFRLNMPKMIIVKRESQLLSAQEIESFAEEFIRAAAGGQDIIINQLQKLKDQKIAAGEYTITTADNFKLQYGRNNLPLFIESEGDIKKRIFYAFEFGLKTEVLTAARDISYGSRIKKRDFRLEERVLYSDPAQVIKERNSSLLGGKELKRSLRKGQLLKKDDLKIPTAVQWGDKLMIKINVNNINITTFVAARDRGAVGDLITVENESTGYRFKVEILSETEAKMLSK